MRTLFSRSGIAAGLLASLFAAGAAGDDKADAIARIDRFVQDWQPTAEERRFDDIAWAPDVPAALKLGKEHGRPVFLFTHDGHIHIGRC